MKLRDLTDPFVGFALAASAFPTVARMALEHERDAARRRALRCEGTGHPGTLLFDWQGDWTAVCAECRTRQPSDDVALMVDHCWGDPEPPVADLIRMAVAFLPDRDRP